MTARHRRTTTPIYKDRAFSIDERVSDLLKRMTLAEKICQLTAGSDWVSRKHAHVLGDRNGRLRPAMARRFIGRNGISQLSNSLKFSMPRQGARLGNAIQRFALEETRLGIPIIIHDEALHGLTSKGSTSFPQAIGLASAWDPDLMSRISVAIGKETACRGIRQVLSPTINIARDPRCGRTEETYGEDPFLTSRMAVAFIRGVQSQGVVATPKHFAANFVGDGGRDSHEIHFSERILREIYFPAFEAAVAGAGALSIMAAYNSLDGIPCSSNKWLLTDVLRNEWKFKGYVVSDYESVEGIRRLHNVAATNAEAGKMAVEAGLDVELPLARCYKDMLALAEKGHVSIEAIDNCVRNVLRVKFMLGLFDRPYVQAAGAARICHCREHRNLALEAARKAMVLLKNRRNTLPLGKDVKSIAVIGPNANEVRLGGYSGVNAKQVTPLAGLRRKAGKRVTVRFAKGCEVTGDSRDGFEEAVKLAAASDAAILFMGNSGKTEGEHRDRCNLNLPGVQEDLILEVAATGTPVVVVLIGGSAVTMTRWLDKAQAVLEAWYPGEEGGNAIADVLFGNCNPGGRLPITFPRTTGQLPLYYNYKPHGRADDYADLRGEQALFPLGYGLSYTTFKYSNLRVRPKRITPNGKVAVSVTVKNTGERRGDEVVQLYLSDLQGSVSRPIKELKGFKRITLGPGRKQRVEFTLGEKELRFLDKHLEYVVEPGRFQVMAGGSSAKGLKAGFMVQA